MKLTTSEILAGIILLLSSILSVEAFDSNTAKLSKRTLRSIDENDIDNSIFPSINHPVAPIYANQKNDYPVATNSWYSSLFYHSVANKTITLVPDPYLVKLIDNTDGIPGIALYQPTEKITHPYEATNNMPATPVGFVENADEIDVKITASEWSLSKPPTQKVVRWDLFSFHLRLTFDNGKIDIPMSRGDPYFSFTFSHLTPQFYFPHGIAKIEAYQVANDTYYDKKLKVTLKDKYNSTYIIYDSTGIAIFVQKDEHTLISYSEPSNVFEIAKLPRPEDEEILDTYVGNRLLGVTVQTQINDDAQYTINWKTLGQRNALTYVYKHQLDSFIEDSVNVTSLTLPSVAKGPMVAVSGINWKLKAADLPDIDWFPRQPVPHQSKIDEILNWISYDIDKKTTYDYRSGNIYYAAKGLERIALVTLLINKPEITQLNNNTLAVKALDRLKHEFLPFLENRQRNPFRYDITNKGLVLKNGLPKDLNGTGNSRADFGFSYYNNHPYISGYFVVTAAIIHYLDPTWKTNQIQAWTETLIRDVSNPSANDDYFTVFRNFDWFDGHNYGGGGNGHDVLFYGRYETSIAESVNFYWGVKLWALATNNNDLAGTAMFQLSLIKETTYQYFWMLDNNEVRPKEMIQNKIFGTIYERVIDFNSHLGRYMERIHGIQQLPMTPMLLDYIRTPEFVTEEWEQKLKGVVSNVSDSWKGILYLNYASVNATAAYDVLADLSVMELGQSKSYSLYLAATRMNSK